jgi:hypothetical protein
MVRRTRFLLRCTYIACLVETRSPRLRNKTTSLRYTGRLMLPINLCVSLQYYEVTTSVQMHTRCWVQNIFLQEPRPATLHVFFWESEQENGSCSDGRWVALRLGAEGLLPPGCQPLGGNYYFNIKIFLIDVEYMQQSLVSLSIHEY